MARRADDEAAANLARRRLPTTHRSRTVTHPLTKFTRLLLSGIPLLGVTVVVGTFDTAQPASAAPASLDGDITLSWSHVLDDAPCGVALASPTEFTYGSAPEAEIGDRQGNIYAFGLADGTVPSAAWGTSTGASHVGSGGGCNSTSSGTPMSPSQEGISVPSSDAPIDSTASVNPITNDLYFGAGNAAEPGLGGYYSYGPAGNFLWNQVVTNPPTDPLKDVGVQASPSLAEGDSLVEAGSLGQMTYALNSANGIPATNWPQFSADSVFSTAAVGDLYGSGTDDFVVGGASSSGFAYGTHYADGGHLRIYNVRGGLICSANPNEEVDSSPAVGPILAGGAYGIATGTGTYWAGASDENTLKVYDTKCNQVWSDQLNGSTGGSPALANLQGNGLDVVEGTGGATVYAVNASNGSTIWHTNVLGKVLGSVTTADFTGQGYQDVVVPTTLGVEILDGKTGDIVADFDDGSGNGGVPAGEVYGFQNAPLITADPNGTIGITVAGYFALVGGGVQGIVQHFEVSATSGTRVGEAGGWPQFHHDAQLSGFVGGAAPLGQCQRPAASLSGYLTVASDGGIFGFGQDFCGSTGSLALNKPVVGMAMDPGQGGYWLVASDGGIFSYGNAGFYGSTGSLQLNKPIVGMAATADGKGYWLVAQDGGIFSFGDAPFYGSTASIPNQTIVAMASTPDGQGYWEVSTTGVVYSFGDAQFSGDTRGLTLKGSIVGMAPDRLTGGYWLIGSDGGVFSFNAPFYGSTGALTLNKPVVAMQATSDGGGYWFVASDGGIFSYGDAPFKGSMGGQALNRPMVGMSGF